MVDQVVDDALLKRFSLGMVCEDDVLRNQATLYCDPEGKGAWLRTGMLCLPAGGSYTLRWSVYPVASGDYYDFINLVRQDWGSNYTVEGAWAFFDSCWGFYCLKPDGRVASVWELLQDPGLVDRQPDSVCNDFGRDRTWYAWYRQEYLSADRHLVTLANYAAWDFKRYQWVQRQQDCRPGSLERVRINASRLALRRKLLEAIGIRPEAIREG